MNYAGISKPFVSKFSIKPFQQIKGLGQRRESEMFILKGVPVRKERVRAVLWRASK